jgi:hypothetical protein
MGSWRTKYEFSASETDVSSLWTTAKTFLAGALDNSGTKVPEVDVPRGEVYGEVVLCNIWDATTPQSAVLYKVFGKIRNGWNGKLVTKRRAFLRKGSRRCWKGGLRQTLISVVKTDGRDARKHKAGR